VPVLARLMLCVTAATLVLVHTAPRTDAQTAEPRREPQRQSPAAQRHTPAPHRPTVAERAWLTACIGRAVGQPPRAVFGRCGWRVAGACLGQPGEGFFVANLRQPEGRARTTRSCAAVEAVLWQELLDRWQRDTLLALRPAAAEAQRRAQRAFVAFREAACAVEAAAVEGAVGEDNAATCRLEVTALRAAEVKRLHDEVTAEPAEDRP